MSLGVEEGSDCSHGSAPENDFGGFVAGEDDVDQDFEVVLFSPAESGVLTLGLATA